MQKNVFDRIPFTKEDKQLIQQLYSLSGSSQFAKNNAPYILMRVNTISLSDNVDTFVLSTSAHPDDTIFYTSTIDVVDLSVRDGGFF